MARAWIAAFAATAFVLQAMLLSLTPPGAPGATTTSAIAALSANALCLGSGTARADPTAPAPAPDHHSDHACCILCAVPGLAAGAIPVTIPTPVWISAFVVTAARPRPLHLAQPFERSPVRPRAPPA